MADSAANEKIVGLITGIGELEKGTVPAQIENLAMIKHHAAWFAFYGPEPEIEYNWPAVSEATKNKWRLLAYRDWFDASSLAMVNLEQSMKNMDAMIERFCDKVNTTSSI